MEKRDLIKINRQFLLLTRQLALDGTAAELMTGLPRSVIDRIASLDMDEIEELSETVGISLYTLRLSKPLFMFCSVFKGRFPVSGLALPAD